MDFMPQRFDNGRWLHVLTVIDQYTRECLTLHADTPLSGASGAYALAASLIANATFILATVILATVLPAAAPHMLAVAAGIVLGGDAVHQRQ